MTVKSTKERGIVPSEGNGAVNPQLALANVSPHGPQPLVRTMQDMLNLAEIVGRSAALPDVRNVATALLKMLAGHELGFGPFASLVGVHIIEGKPAVGAHLMAAAIKRSDKYRYRIATSTREECSLEWTERIDGKWEVLGHTSLTLAEAVEQGIATKADGKTLKANWQRHSKDMLFARCITQGYRQFAPDLTGSVLAYDPDELERPTEMAVAVTCSQAPAEATGEVIDAEFEVQETPQTTVEPTPDPFPAVAMANTDQIAEITALIGELGFNAGQVKTALAARGAMTFEGLTSQQATDMIEKLKAAAAKKKPG